MEFKRLKNTRDLGGLVMKDGRKIRPGMLIRSSYLAVAPAHDLAILQNTVSDIVDFRTEKERQERPDPEMAGITYHAQPVLADMTAGITREEEADKNEIETYLLDPAGARQHMLEVLRSIRLIRHPRKAKIITEIVGRQVDVFKEFRLPVPLRLLPKERRKEFAEAVGIKG